MATQGLVETALPREGGGPTGPPMRAVPVFRQDVVLHPAAGVGIQAASVIAGSSIANELTVIATGITGWEGYQSRYIFLQTRQSDQVEHGYPDEFALQVIGADLAVGGQSVTFRIKRLDGSGGWGQQLQVDILLLPMSLIP